MGESRQEDGSGHVSKTVLISGVQVPLQQRRLKFAKELTETRRLVRELENFRVKITPSTNETLNTREREHDDLALALAFWSGERMAPWTLGDCAPHDTLVAQLPNDVGAGRGPQRHRQT